MKFPSRRLILLIALFGSVPCAPRATAQPPKPAVAAAPNDWTAYNELEKQLKDAEPQAAIDAWRKLYESRPNILPFIAYNITAHIADLYGDKLGDKAKVLEIADWGIKKYADNPEAVCMVWRKTKTLNELKRYDEAVKTGEDNWNIIVRGGQSGTGWIAMYAATTVRDMNDACEALGQNDKAIALIVKSLNAMPALLDDKNQAFGGGRPGWMYESLVSKLVKAGHTDEALRWAKLHYATASFDKDCLARAHTSLGKVWGETEEYQKIRTFAALQEDGADATIKNPLADVKLPDLDAKQAKEHLARLKFPPQGKLDPYLMKERIGLLIASGDLGGAMTTARRLMKDDPTKDDGPLEICRVFKATDLSTRRANQFLLYLESKAENPLPDFLKEYEPKATASTAPATIPAP